MISLKILDPMTLPIRHVSINGDFNHLSTVLLQERASKVVRGGFFNVNVESIQNVVSEDPWVKDILVRRIWPDRIMVDIKEQEAVAKWKDNALLNHDAMIFFLISQQFLMTCLIYRVRINTLDWSWIIFINSEISYLIH